MGEVVKGPARELSIYRGVWMPALAREIMFNIDVQSMDDVETLRRDGVNIVQLAPELSVNADGSLNLELFNLQAQAIKEAISNYHREGFEVFLTLVVRYEVGGEGEPQPVPLSIAEDPQFIQQYNKVVLEWAEVAEEYGVEVFAPTLEPDRYLGGVKFAAKWCQEILPMVRERYKGKVMVRLAFQDIALEGIDFNIRGYDVLGICIYPFDEQNRISREKVRFFIDEALKLASKYGVPSVVTEFGVWGRAAMLDEETKAEAHRVVLEEGEGKLSGFFVFDPPTSIYKPLKGSLSELVIREWYTKRLLEPARFEIDSLTITPKEAQMGEEVEINVKVSNIGEKAGSTSLTLKINGEVEEVREVTLNGGENLNITFKVSRQKAGIYHVEVDGKTGEFEVKPPTPETQKPTEKPPETTTIRRFMRADLNRDGKVNLKDFETLKKLYGLSKEMEGFQPEADLNSDGKIDIIDLAILASKDGES